MMSAIATQIERKRLLSEVSKDDVNRQIFFWLIMAFLASTSYSFGQTYLAKFYWALLGNNQLIPPPMKEMLFPMLGGASALLVTTAGYAWWKRIKFMATTGQQWRYAQIGEYMSFVSDMAYTVIALVTLIAGDKLEPALRSRIEWASLILFICVCAAHGILKHLYESSGTAVTERRINTRTAGTRQTEALLYKELVSMNAIALASENAQNDAQAYATQLGALWLSEMIGALPQVALSAPANVETPIAPIEKFEPPSNKPKPNKQAGKRRRLINSSRPSPRTSRGHVKRVCPECDKVHYHKTTRAKAVCKTCRERAKKQRQRANT